MSPGNTTDIIQLLESLLIQMKNATTNQKPISGGSPSGTGGNRMLVEIDVDTGTVVRKWSANNEKTDYPVYIPGIGWIQL